jgi:transposase
MRGSRPVRLKQTEYEWVYLFGAVCPATGDSVGLVAPTANTDLMNVHLRMISEHVGVDVHIVLVLDRAGWHVAKRLTVPENITLLYLPPYSPELNPMERLWWWMKQHNLSNRIYADYEALFGASCEAWNQLDPQRLMSICRASWAI